MSVAVVQASHGETSYGVGICNGKMGMTNLITRSVLPPKKWAVVGLRLDPDAKLETAYLDGQKLQTTPYDPSQFSSIIKVAVWGWLGDYVQPKSE